MSTKKTATKKTAKTTTKKVPTKVVKVKGKPVNKPSKTKAEKIPAKKEPTQLPKREQEIYNGVLKVLDKKYERIESSDAIATYRAPDIRSFKAAIDVVARVRKIYKSSGAFDFIVTSMCWKSSEVIFEMNFRGKYRS